MWNKTSIYLRQRSIYIYFLFFLNLIECKWNQYFFNDTRKSFILSENLILPWILVSIAKKYILIMAMCKCRKWSENPGLPSVARVLFAAAHNVWKETFKKFKKQAERLWNQIYRRDDQMEYERDSLQHFTR